MLVRRPAQGALLALFLSGCGAVPAVSPRPAAARARGVPAVKNARERLAAALRALPRAEPVLAALPPEVRARLTTRLASLDAERKLAVQGDEGALVQSLPLLHLASGGTSPRALFALATTPAGAEELSGLVVGESDASARIHLVNELARRAAQNFLRDRAADVMMAGKQTALVGRLVARAALGLGNREIVLLAREVLAEVEPTPENRLEFARELARSGDVRRATRVLHDARADRAHSPPLSLLTQVERAVSAATFVSQHPAPRDASDRLALARAFLHLGRFAEARRVLQPDVEQAKSSLGLATVFAETLVERPSCPELPLGVGTAPLCAEAFRASPRVKQALELLASAWHSGAGRDDEAVESYAALAQVIPWMHETALAVASGALTPAESSARVAQLHTKIAEIVAVAPRLAGLSLFVGSLRGDAVSSAQETSADADALMARALALGKVDQNRFAQAGILGVAAALSRTHDVSALIDAVPLEKAEPSLRVPRAALNVWAAAASGSQSRMDGARSELASVMSESLGDSLERARLVLSVSEADALLAASERSYQLLSRVAGQLLQDSVPPDLAFRAVLDATGALDHGHRLDRARQVLAGAVDAKLPPDQGRARELLALVRGTALVLSLDRADADALALARTKLATLAAAPSSASTALWFELWTHELEARERAITCQKRQQRSCPDAIRLRRLSRHEVDERIGAQSAAVLLRGALPAGVSDAGFRFTAENGLEPFIVFDPNLIAIRLPQLTIE